jgi:CheY-like chemotaxis protein
MAGGIAHDFNNILGAMLGYGEMALRGVPTGTRLHRDLENIMIAGERGRALVDRILAFSRSGVGERVAVHVEAVICEVLELLSPKLPANVRVELDLRAARAAMLGDPTQVHQVFMNLATNAVQAMASGGVLRVSLETLRLDEPCLVTTGKVSAGEFLVLKVIDCGVGIAPEILERIFDPFFTTKEVGVGTGLGLSLVYGIVAELGGAIDVASAVGRGSAFTVYLPRAGDAVEQQPGEQTPLPRGNGQRVLMVDDEELLVKLAIRTLEGLGYAPVGFASSVAALEAFRADAGLFDAIVTDERMPGLTGSELIREVRAMRPAIPILLVGGYVGGQVTALALEAGADEVLKKPLLARELATSLARVLRGRG